MIAGAHKKALQSEQVSHVVRKSSEFLLAETLRWRRNWRVLPRLREANGSNCPTATIHRSQVL